jgi:hypothetical protein
MSIQRGDSAPVITTDASDLSVVSNTLDIDLIIQQWLNSQGGAEAIDNCGSITWSHNYNLDLTPGEHVVMFKATSDNGVASETSATLTIELASSSEDIIEQNALSIYPNPSNGEFSIILEEDNHLKSKLEVFNPLGEIIFFTTLDQDIKIHQLNLSHIDNGIYVVKLSNLLGEKSSILVKY